MADKGKYTDYLFEQVFGHLDRASTEYKKFKLLRRSPESLCLEDVRSYRLFRSGYTRNNRIPRLVNNAVYEVDDDIFIALKIKPPLDEVLIALEKCNIYQSEINQGIFLALAPALNLQIQTRSQKQLENELWSQHEDEAYQGHDWEELREYFEDFTLFRVSKGESVTQHKDNLVLFILSFYTEFTQLNDQGLLETYRDLIAKSPPQVNENLFLSLSSTHWKHSFIEAYRCLEGLFSIPAAIRLKMSLKLDCKASELAKIARTELGWKRVEVTSLMSMLSLLPDDSFTNTFDISQLDTFSDLELSFKTAIDRTKAIESIARKIYRIRNQLVHQFDEKDLLNIPDQDWPKLIELMLMCVEKCYEKLADEIESG
ncbi:hypothetical protein [Pseudidiomarina woesei]|uniref:Uncharacterized protein n=1 Tax=Pseudidiomarina woesei TaxID=1381080 RepID=A0A0K6HAF1_9GAMM|nr:hypothetical protein [Pseudidiomarina woesei]CUA87871.1 hypothetical protein Ga0061064_1970 [Pseudidiomarina woesei]